MNVGGAQPRGPGCRPRARRAARTRTAAPPTVITAAGGAAPPRRRTRAGTRPRSSARSARRDAATELERWRARWRAAWRWGRPVVDLGAPEIKSAFILRWSSKTGTDWCACPWTAHSGGGGHVGRSATTAAGWRARQTRYGGVSARWARCGGPGGLVEWRRGRGGAVRAPLTMAGRPASVGQPRVAVSDRTRGTRRVARCARNCGD